MSPSTASSTPLSLFPSAASTFPPRSSSMKRVPARETRSAQPKLQGLALQVTSMQPAKSKVQPAEEQLKHSLFCDPVSESPVQTTLAGKAPKERRRSSGPIKSLLHGQKSSLSEDQSPLPALALAIHPSPFKRGVSQRQPSQAFDSSGVRCVKYQNSQNQSPVSTTSEKNRRLDVSNPPPGYSAAHRKSSGLSMTGSDTKSSCHAQPRHDHSAPMQSIFPQYDPTKSLNQQNYYPPPVSQAPTIPIHNVSKIGSPVERKATQTIGPDLTLIDGYEHIPYAETTDVSTIWKASRGEHTVHGRKVRLGLLQPREGASLAIGRTEKELLYTMNTKSPSSPSYSEVKGAGKQLTIRRHSLETAAQVASLVLPAIDQPILSSGSQLTSLFPEQAAVHAIESVVNSPAAAQIAASDPNGSSQAAARLAQDAVAVAHMQQSCTLTRTTRQRDSLGSVIALYSLKHPSLGTFAITIAKSFISGAAHGARAKISIHHPSATPAAITAETLVLAFLDFARDACVLDIPSLLSLECPYLIDLAVIAMLAVAAIENDAILSEKPTFAPPPKTPVKASSSSSSSPTAKKQKKQNKKNKPVSRRARITKKVQDEVFGEQVELPLLTQGAISLVSLSLKVAFVVVEVGVKVTTNVVVGAGRLAMRL